MEKETRTPKNEGIPGGVGRRGSREGTGGAGPKIKTQEKKKRKPGGFKKASLQKQGEKQRRWSKERRTRIIRIVCQKGDCSSGKRKLGGGGRTGRRAERAEISPLEGGGRAFCIKKNGKGNSHKLGDRGGKESGGERGGRRLKKCLSTSRTQSRGRGKEGGDWGKGGAKFEGKENIELEKKLRRGVGRNAKGEKSVDPQTGGVWGGTGGGGGATRFAKRDRTEAEKKKGGERRKKGTTQAV